MRGFLVLLGTLVLWIVLNRWVLPLFGIHTCMSGDCSTQCWPACGPETDIGTDKGALEQGNQK